MRLSELTHSVCSQKTPWSRKRRAARCGARGGRWPSGRRRRAIEPLFGPDGLAALGVADAVCRCSRAARLRSKSSKGVVPPDGARSPGTAGTLFGRAPSSGGARRARGMDRGRRPRPDHDASPPFGQAAGPCGGEQVRQQVHPRTRVKVHHQPVRHLRCSRTPQHRVELASQVRRPHQRGLRRRLATTKAGGSNFAEPSSAPTAIESGRLVMSRQGSPARRPAVPRHAWRPDGATDPSSPWSPSGFRRKGR